MIVLMGHHDAGRKLLKKLVTYQDAIVYDCTDSNKYSDLVLFLHGSCMMNQLIIP